MQAKELKQGASNCLSSVSRHRPVSGSDTQQFRYSVCSLRSGELLSQLGKLLRSRQVKAMMYLCAVQVDSSKMGAMNDLSSSGKFACWNQISWRRCPSHRGYPCGGGSHSCPSHPAPKQPVWVSKTLPCCCHLGGHELSRAKRFGSAVHLMTGTAPVLSQRPGPSASH